MEKTFAKIQQGYQAFRKKYTVGDNSVMRSLAISGQKPEIMVVACCDSRVDPALILQCDPGDLFIMRNVANIIPPYEHSQAHDGAKAALEFGICYLNVKHLIILGHSQCGGIHALLNGEAMPQNDFIKTWVSLIKIDKAENKDADFYAKSAILQSHQHCLSYPWIADRVKQKKLSLDLWFFDITSGQIFAYSDVENDYLPLV